MHTTFDTPFDPNRIFFIQLRRKIHIVIIMRHSRRLRDRRQNIDGIPRGIGLALFELERLNGFGEGFLVQHAQPIVEKLLATARATNLPAGGFGDGFGGDDEDFFGRKPVGLADEGGELFAEARIVVGGVTPFAEFHDDDEGFFLVPCDLRVKEGGSRDGEGGDGALLDLRERVAGVFDVLRVVVLPADDDEIFGSPADVEFVIVV